MQQALAPYPAQHMVGPKTKDNVNIAQESMCVVYMHSRVHSKALEGQKDLGETWGTPQALFPHPCPALVSQPS